MNAHTGQAVGGLDHIRQSMADILTTPLGTRVMRRDYGSRLFELLDGPLNPAHTLRLYAATVDALIRWEPRLQVSRVTAQYTIHGQLTLTISGQLAASGDPLSTVVTLPQGGRRS